jgi:hypothetical protein
MTPGLDVMTQLEGMAQLDGMAQNTLTSSFPARVGRVEPTLSVASAARASSCTEVQ